MRGPDVSGADVAVDGEAVTAGLVGLGVLVFGFACFLAGAGAMQWAMGRRVADDVRAAGGDGYRLLDLGGQERATPASSGALASLMGDMIAFVDADGRAIEVVPGQLDAGIACRWCGGVETTAAEGEAAVDVLARLEREHAARCPGPSARGAG